MCVVFQSSQHIACPPPRPHPKHCNHTVHFTFPAGPTIWRRFTRFGYRVYGSHLPQHQNIVFDDERTRHEPQRISTDSSTPEQHPHSKGHTFVMQFIYTAGVFLQMMIHTDSSHVTNSIHVRHNRHSQYQVITRCASLFSQNKPKQTCISEYTSSDTQHSMDCE